jgi:hypothetical protein
VGPDEDMSRQQPVTTRTALGWSVHPLPVRAAHQLANLSSHSHHISSPCIVNPGRCTNRDYSVVFGMESIAAGRGKNLFTWTKG